MEIDVAMQFAISQDHPASAACGVHLVVSHEREIDSLTIGRLLQPAIELTLHRAEMKRAIASFREREMTWAFEINEFLVPLLHFNNPPLSDKRSRRFLRARCHVSFRDLVIS